MRCALPPCSLATSSKHPAVGCGQSARRDHCPARRTRLFDDLGPAEPTWPKRSDLQRAGRKRDEVATDRISVKLELVTVAINSGSGSFSTMGCDGIWAMQGIVLSSTLPSSRLQVCAQAPPASAFFPGAPQPLGPRCAASIQVLPIARGRRRPARAKLERRCYPSLKCGPFGM